MDIKLLIDDQEKTFVSGRPKGRVVREAAAIAEQAAKGINGETIDKIIDFVVDIFEKQFTRDQVYDGLHYDELMPTLMSIIEQLVSGTSKRIESKNA